MGTVTFLFTDVEGSTQLWEQRPDEMRAALARHDDLLRDAISSSDGRVFKTTGDGLLAVFADAAFGAGGCRNGAAKWSSRRCRSVSGSPCTAEPRSCVMTTTSVRR